MIVIDTNVLSELWKVEPDSNVLAWIDAQAIETPYLSAITVVELRYSLATMPEGKRRTIYQERLEDEVLPNFAGRVLAFDLGTSKTYGELMARARAEGKTVAKADGYITATAATHGTVAATRDTSSFKAGGLEVIDP
ncbi:MAG: type II toxin-antitoxin system VapC family toxin [Pseudomonadota bacterium]